MREAGLKELREQILRMGGLAEQILDKSLRSLLERDEELAAEVAGDDLEIDRLDVEIDDTVLQVLALRAPVAEELRGVVAMKMMATDLERVGDLARNIAEAAIRMARRPLVTFPSDLERIATGAQGLVRRALDSFVKHDGHAARAVIDADDEIDDLQEDLVRRAIDVISERPENAAQEIDVILTAEHLERVADHATNIAEDVVLLYEALNLKHASKLNP